MKYILLHGLSQGPKAWDAVARNLAVGSEAEVVIPDLFALTAKEDLSYEKLYRAFVLYCAGIYDATDGEEMNLIGSSLGGLLALQLAIEHPEMVRSLVVIGAPLKMPRMLINIQNILFRFMPSKTFAQMGMSKKDVIGFMKSVTKLDLTSDVERIKCPTLVVIGEKDRPNMKAALNLRDLIPNSGIMLIEGAGHQVNTEEPAKLAEVINEFYVELEDLSDSSPQST